MRTIVMPGDQVSSDVKSNNVYIENGKVFASVLGLYDETIKKIIPLEGMWVPKADETVVGVIEAIGRNNTYEVDLASFQQGVLILGRYSRAKLKVGDVIEAIVDRLNGKNKVMLSNPRILNGGTIVSIKPTKVPRVLGRANTMAKQIAELTKCNMVVGSNGIIWIKGKNVALAIEAILRIETDAHVSGLTEKIRKMLMKNSTINNNSINNDSISKKR